MIGLAERIGRSYFLYYPTLLVSCVLLSLQNVSYLQKLWARRIYYKCRWDLFGYKH